MCLRTRPRGEQIQVGPWTPHTTHHTPHTTWKIMFNKCSQFAATVGLQHDSLPTQGADEEVHDDVQLLHPAPVRDAGQGGGGATASVWPEDHADDDVHDEVDASGHTEVSDGLRGGTRGDSPVLHFALRRLGQKSWKALEAAGQYEQGGLCLAGTLLQDADYPGHNIQTPRHPGLDQ